MSRRMARTAIDRPRSGPDGRGFACKHPNVAQASLAWAKFGMPSSAAIIFLPNLVGYSGALTGPLATTWHGSKWLLVSYCSARVLSHSPYVPPARCICWAPMILGAIF